jgi:hypothetical protein
MENVVLYVSEPAPALSNVSVSYQDLLAHPERYYQVIEGELRAVD